MDQKKFTIQEAIGFGFQKAKENLGFFITLGVISLLMNIVPMIILSMIDKDATWLRLLIQLAVNAVSLIVGIGSLKLTLDVVDGRKPEISTLLSYTKYFWPTLGAGILVGLLVILGFILLIIPGIILGLGLQFYNYFVIDKDAGAVESLRMSWNATKGYKLYLAWFGLVLLGVNLLGILLLIVGLIWTVPTSMIATAYVYRKLST